MNTLSAAGLESLSDDELTAELRRLVGCERRATAVVLSHLAEFDARRLYLGAGFSSLFGYCTGALRFSGQGAYNRIEAARAARKFPLILELLGNGDINLTNVRLLAPHLTPENHRALLDEAAGKSRLQVEELLARRFPQPAVPASVRKLPAPMFPRTMEAPRGSATGPSADSGCAGPYLPATRESAPPSAAPSVSATPTPLAAPWAPARRSVVVPLASDRYKVTFTATAATWRKLRQAQELLRHQVPDGDLTQVVDRALSALVEELTRSKFAAATQARRSRVPDSAPTASGRHIPAEVRRAVWERDRGACAFVSRDGRRCGERNFVEFHHLRPFAVGGAPTTANIALRCRSHNGYEAAVYFGPLRCLEAQAVPP